jgi:hypothetical protein
VGGGSGDDAGTKISPEAGSRFAQIVRKRKIKKTITKLWLGILILALLSPLGILLPQYFKAGDAWGEWGTERVKGLAGYIPQGLGKISTLWTAPFPDYNFKGLEAHAPATFAAYLICAVMGVLVIASVVLLIIRNQRR